MNTERDISGNAKAMDIWTELYDPKVGRKLREIPFGGKCEKCGEWSGHKLDCDMVDMEQLYRIAKTAQKAEGHARKRADRYWKMLQQYQGKLATLRHENNRLRKANEKMRNGHRNASQERIITPSEQLCPKCGSANTQCAFRERGEEWKTYGVSKPRTSTRVTIEKWFGAANQDCIVHHCRCCHFEWDTDALE